MEDRTRRRKRTDSPVLSCSASSRSPLSATCPSAQDQRPSASPDAAPALVIFSCMTFTCAPACQRPGRGEREGRGRTHGIVDLVLDIGYLRVGASGAARQRRAGSDSMISLFVRRMELLPTFLLCAAPAWADWPAAAGAPFGREPEGMYGSYGSEDLVGSDEREVRSAGLAYILVCGEACASWRVV